jgi:hypothetical protein
MLLTGIWKTRIFGRLLILLSILAGCNNKPGANFINSELNPILEPDYTDITIPPNIAPLNFSIKEKGKSFYAKFSNSTGDEIGIRSVDGKIQIPARKWKELLKKSEGRIVMVDIFLRNDEDI